MPREHFLAAVAAIALCACTPDAPVATASSVSRAAPDQQFFVPPVAVNRVGLPTRALAVHNSYRAQAGVPPLQWDENLAIAAAGYARQLAATGLFAHSPRTSRPGQGENLWTGTSGAYTLETMLRHWGEERTLFRPGIFPGVSRTGNWAQVAHYTQMVWRSTTAVGCAIETGRGSDHRGSDYLVCRYSPSGNRNGDPVP